MDSILSSCPELMLKTWRTKPPGWGVEEDEQVYNGNPVVFNELTDYEGEDNYNKRRFAGIKFTNKDNQDYFLFHGDRWGRERIVAFTWTKDLPQPIIHLSALNSWFDQPDFNSSIKWKTRALYLDEFMASPEATQYYGDLYGESDEKIALFVEQGLDIDSCLYMPFRYKQITDMEDILIATIKLNISTKHDEDCSALTDCTPDSTELVDAPRIIEDMTSTISHELTQGAKKPANTRVRKSTRLCISNIDGEMEVLEAPPAKRATAVAATAAITSMTVKTKPVSRSRAPKPPPNKGPGKAANTRSKAPVKKKEKTSDDQDPYTYSSFDDYEDNDVVQVYPNNKSYSTQSSTKLPVQQLCVAHAPAPAPPSSSLSMEKWMEKLAERLETNQAPAPAPPSSAFTIDTLMERLAKRLETKQAPAPAPPCSTQPMDELLKKLADRLETKQAAAPVPAAPEFCMEELAERVAAKLGGKKESAPAPSAPEFCMEELAERVVAKLGGKKESAPAPSAPKFCMEELAEKLAEKLDGGKQGRAQNRPDAMSKGNASIFEDLLQNINSSQRAVHNSTEDSRIYKMAMVSNVAHLTNSIFSFANK